MTQLTFTPARASYAANRMLGFIERLHAYASTTPTDLAQAKDMLAAIATVCRHMCIYIDDTHDQWMIGNYPVEAFENDSCATPGTFEPTLAEESIRQGRAAA